MAKKKEMTNEEFMAKIDAIAKNPKAMAKLEADCKKLEDEDNSSRAYGKKMGKNFAKRFDHPDRQGVDSIQGSLALGEMLHYVYKAARSCGGQLLKWSIGEHYKQIWIEDALPALNETYELFKKHHVTRRNPHCYGDMDGYMWYEKPKGCKYKVLCYTSSCSCADDSTHVFIWDDRFKDHRALGVDLHVRRLYGRCKKRGNNWNDCRDYDRMSLAVFRKHKFELTYGTQLGYGDGRDNGYAISITGRSKADDVFAFIPQTEHALWVADYLYQEARNIDEDPEEYDR